MKKYLSGFLFFFLLTFGCLIGLFLLTLNQQDDQTQRVQATEAVEQTIFAEEDSEPIHLVLNQHSVQSRMTDERYYLTMEEGYLLIYDQEDHKVDLVTYVPVSEFPLAEQERLMTGIWFATMADLFSYLESCTS